MAQTDADLAARALREESEYRFPSFASENAITLGLSLRKRFRGSSRHNKGRGLVISVQTIAGHTLFSCTVGDLGHPSGVGDVSLDSWAVLQSMVDVVKRTGHSSYYVEKSMNAMGKTPKQLGMQNDVARVSGGAYPIWLENAPCCPIGVVACFSGSSQDDHNLVVNVVRDYIIKMQSQIQSQVQQQEAPSMPMPEVHQYEEHEHDHEWHHNGQTPLPIPPGSEFGESLYTSHT